MAQTKQELVVEVTTKADAAKAELAALDKQAKQLGETPIEIPVKPVDLPGADDTRHKVDELGRSAEGSRNAFANLVGNSAQDLGGLLGPLGSVGVAVGQVAEYTSDAALGGESMTKALSGAAAMAVPMAGLSVALLVVTNLVQDYQKRQKEIQAAQAAGTKAFEDATGAVATWGKALDDAFSTGTADKVQTLNKVIKDALGKETTDKVIQGLGAIGKTADDLGETMLSVDQDFRSFATGILVAGGATEKQASLMVDLIQSSRTAATAIGKMSEANIDVKGMGLEDAVTSLANLNGEARKQDFEKYADDALKAAGAISTTSEAVKTARDSTTNATDAWRVYQEGQQKAQQASEENARATEEGAKAAAESGTILDQVGRQVADASKLAEDAMSKAKVAQDDWLLKNVDAQAASDALTESIYKLVEGTQKQTDAGVEGAGMFEGNSKAALDNRDALGDVYGKALDVIQGMKDAGLSVDDARGKQNDMAQSAYDLAVSLGFPVAKAQEIKDKINAIPPSVTTEVKYTERGYEDRLAEQERLERDIHNTVYFAGVVDRNLQAYINSGIFAGAQIAPSSAAAPAPAGAVGVATLAAPQAVSAPSRAATVNVNLSGAVVADTFQLQRVVSRAVRQGNRLSGTRRYS